jgi:hypothetical protein
MLHLNNAKSPDLHDKTVILKRVRINLNFLRPNSSALYSAPSEYFGRLV